MSPSKALTHEQPLLLLGSCFSEEIGSLLAQNGFTCLVNPGGTIFHPMALAKLLNWALAEPSTLRTHVREDIHLSWDLSGTFYALSALEFEKKSIRLHQDIRHYLQHASHLLLTFGTAWAYELKSDGQIVANCHKHPASEFEKQLTGLDQLQRVWEPLLDQLQVFNPRLELIFTVSPVRHLKDGLVENTRSKARLHLLVERLCARENCCYFEAYEIVRDQLRDYAYYKADGAHPNLKAIEAVWLIFQELFMDKTTKQRIDEWSALQQLKAHRVLYPESREAKKFKSQILQKEKEFFSKYPQFKDSTRS